MSHVDITYHRLGEIGSEPLISVIIPTYNRAAKLDMTIESLLNQTYAKDKYEIVVVDNNSNDKTKEVVHQWMDKSHVNVEYLFEAQQGVHYARNMAAKHATGEILYYTDDDMLADPQLLEEIIKPFSHSPLVACVTGRVLPKWEVAPPAWILQFCLNGHLSLLDRPEELLISPYDCGVYSCHQAVRRDVFFLTGGFNPENTAGEWIGDGETGLNIKIRELGYQFAYTRRAVTYHMIPASRTTQSYLNKRLANQGNCDSYTAYRRHTPTSSRLARRSLRHAVNLLVHGANFVIKRCAFLPSWRMNRAWVNYYVNRLRYDFRLIYDLEWRALVLKHDWLSERVDEAQISGEAMDPDTAPASSNS